MNELTIEQLERRVEQLEAERDEAREDVIVRRTSDIIRRNYLYRHLGEDLTSDQIKLIRRGELTVEQAVADRNARWPIFTYGEPDGLTLEQAYKAAR